MNILRALLCIASLFAYESIHASQFTGKVIAVLDGDTILVMQGRNPVKVRLAEIDAPEKNQPYGSESQQSMSRMVMGKTVQIESRAIDAYGRMIAMVSVDGLNVNHEQVRLGMAWENSRFHNNKDVLAMQREAQLARRGLWAGESNEIIEPSQWRKLHPSKPPTAPSPATALHVEPLSGMARRNDPALRLSSGQACAKKLCSQMNSCDEARDYLSRCHTHTLDGDGDGIPCESLCVPEAAH